MNQYVSEWMHPRPFQRNNINFRISSCNSIILFKKRQEFVLNQLAYTPHHTFSQLAKEILLLKYDIWYDFINDMEQYLLCNYTESRDILINTVIELSDVRVKYYEGILEKEFTGKIEKEYISLWKSNHIYTYDFMIRELRKVQEQDPMILFSKMVALLSDIMNFTLYELQELDILIYSNDVPSLSIDPIYYGLNKAFPNFLEDKINKFIKIRPFKEIIIKNHLGDNILEITCKYFLDVLDKNNIKYSII